MITLFLVITRRTKRIDKPVRKIELPLIYAWCVLRPWMTFENVIKKPTCFKGDTPTLLDVLLVSDNNTCKAGSVTPCPLSDFHHFIHGVFNIQMPRTTTRRIIYRSYKHFNAEDFGSDLRKAPFHVGEVLDVNTHMEYFQQLFLNILDQHAPIKTKVVKTTQVPHMTKEWKCLIYQRNMTYNTYCQNRSMSNWERYRKLRNKCSNMSKSALKNYFTRNCEEDKNGKSKKFWRVIKPFFSKKAKTSESIQLEVNGNIISDPQEVAEAFNSHYLSVAKSIGANSKYAKCIENHPSYEVISKHVQDNNIPEFNFHSVTLKDIDDIIDRLPTNKSPGYDSISGKCVKSVKHVVNVPIQCLVNRMFVESFFPDPLKPADVSPVYKKNNNLLAPNFRPVSVLITFSKIFELAMSDQLDPHLNLLYSVYLSAYRKSIGCNSTLTFLLETWKEALDNDRYVGIVMMDLSKAFDCLPHDLIIAKLEKYNFGGGACCLMRSYLTNRTQKVKIGSKRSSGGFLEKGVPQGSILGPKIFNCFINDLLITLSRYCTPGNYADDNTVCTIHSNKEIMLSKLQTACNIALQWFDDNLMQANPEKFQFMVLSPFQKEAKCQYTLEIANVILHSVLQAPLLGITFDTELNFSAHVKGVHQKANFQLLTLKRFNNMLDASTKLTILKSFIRSNLTYCCHIWYFTSPTLREKIEKIQFRGLRYVYNDYSTYESLLEKSGMQSIDLLIQKTILVEIFKCLHGIGAAYLANLFSFGKNSTRSNSRDLIVPRVLSSTYGIHSLRYHGTKLWANLPSSAKSAKDIDTFKVELGKFKGITCKCKQCKFFKPGW